MTALVGLAATATGLATTAAQVWSAGDVSPRSPGAKTTGASSPGGEPPARPPRYIDAQLQMRRGDTSQHPGRGHPNLRRSTK